MYIWYCTDWNYVIIRIRLFGLCFYILNIFHEKTLLRVRFLLLRCSLLRCRGLQVLLLDINVYIVSLQKFKNWSQIKEDKKKLLKRFIKNLYIYFIWIKISGYKFIYSASLYVKYLIFRLRIKLKNVRTTLYIVHRWK